jgi:hypothetical protein
MTIVNPRGGWIRAVLPTVGLALACAGCGGSHPGHVPSATPTAGGDTGRPPARTPGLPPAADGTNVRACHDGSCEILVTGRVSIPLTSRFGFKTFSFDAADSTWRYTYPNGGSGSLSFKAPPYSGSWAGPTAEQSLVLTVVASEGSKAVISLRPGK